ncbi:ATP-dependent protease ClpP protease subunit/outer membrane biosynthesis protein TonB [Pontibacter aydingkolensis]|uniref:ATP-dependent Clp protease proteolytic subunit n=1 Tax=Pontibacter aydingkolensis TaxID=1911536 RepID=A0ABS7CQS2_9BACT|nr:Clp protease ClpP [Pontibacter aydingkolensis]MBW7466196.1 ATP-dependent Clp protease proteolytic subunit [Pontibacter aydingkolensis]
MELRYTHIDESMESAVMLLKGTIGLEVDTVQFVNEIKYLEKLGVENLEIRINSGGGSVLAGYDIVDALLTTPMNTTTYIAGMAGSMAGVIAMAGKTVRIVNYGLLMIHSVGGIDNPAVIEKFNQSLIAIFNTRPGINKSYMEQLMAKETFFTAQEAIDAGFVDEIVATNHTITQDARNTSLEELVNIYNKIDIKVMEEPKVEETVIENAEVVVETPEVINEEAVTEEVIAEPEEAKVEEPKEEAVAEESADELKAKLEELAKANEVLTAKLAEQEKVANELVEKENNRLKAEKEAKEMAVINSALEAGKITADVKDTWVNFIKIDFDGAKKALDNIVVNKASVDIMDIVNKSTAANAIPTEKTFRQLEKENPAELERILNETPEIFKEMYKREYGVYPTL